MGYGTPGMGTCVSNCGINVFNNAQPPAQFRKIGYFEAWNPERPCLWWTPAPLTSPSSPTST
jgi:hypothetical protein